MRIEGIFKLITMLALFSANASYSLAGTFSGTVTDQNGEPIEHAVITLVGENEGMGSDSAVMPPPVMTQHNIQFTPFVLPVAAGTTVSFPNKDKVRHHVYSFSKVKRFELELYGEDEEKTILFDTLGSVALGCNIHDNMLAYIYIARSSSFAKSEKDGRAIIENLPDGIYTAYVWHPRLNGDEEDYIQEVTISGSDMVSATFEVSLKRERNRRRSDY